MYFVGSNSDLYSVSATAVMCSILDCIILGSAVFGFASGAWNALPRFILINTSDVFAVVWLNEVIHDHISELFMWIKSSLEPVVFVMCVARTFHPVCINLCLSTHKHRADSRFAPSWETPLLFNDVSHWLSTNLESALKQYIPSPIPIGPWCCVTFLQARQDQNGVWSTSMPRIIAIWITTSMYKSQYPQLSLLAPL